MTVHHANLDLKSALAPPNRYPSWRTRALRAVVDGARTSFLCGGCGRCWQPALGHTSKVDPHGCSEYKHRQQRLANPSGGAAPSLLSR